MKFSKKEYQVVWFQGEKVKISDESIAITLERDLKNQAETLCLEAEKQLAMFEEKIPNDEKQKLQSLIENIRNKVKTDDLTSLKSLIEELKTSMREILPQLPQKGKKRIIIATAVVIIIAVPAGFVLVTQPASKLALAAVASQFQTLWVKNKLGMETYVDILRGKELWIFYKSPFYAEAHECRSARVSSILQSKRAKLSSMLKNTRDRFVLKTIVDKLKDRWRLK